MLDLRDSVVFATARLERAKIELKAARTALLMAKLYLQDAERAAAKDCERYQF